MKPTTANSFEAKYPIAPGRPRPPKRVAWRLLWWWPVTLCWINCGFTNAQSPTSRQLEFAGLQWNVRSGGGGPGPNRWDQQNVSVDAMGYLHLWLRKSDEGWTCAEVSTTKSFGFGTYEYEVIGQLDKLDPQVVLGLFHYPRGPDADGTREIDIEFARWGNAAWPWGNYTVWPNPAAGDASKSGKPTSHTFNIALPTNRSKHRYRWSATQIVFESFDSAAASPSPPLQSWTFSPAEASKAIAQQPMPLHINLWCFQGKGPQSTADVEIVIRSLRFEPQP